MRLRKSEVVPQAENKSLGSSKNILRTLSTGAAALLLVGCGPQGTSNESNPTPEPSPSNSAPATPGETSDTNGTSTETESPLDTFGVNANENPTFEDAVTAYFEKYNMYQSSASHTYDEPGDLRYLEALFGSDWESNAELEGYTQWLQDSSVTISTNHFATGENGDVEYEHNVEVTGVREVSESPAQVSGIVSIHATDNVMETVLSAFSSTGVNLDSEGEFHFTFANVGGYWQMTEVDNLNNNMVDEPVEQ